MKRWICLLMVMALLAAPNAVAFAGEEVDPAEDAYTMQHLEYIDTDEYTDTIMAVPGGIAGIIADSFEDSRLVELNKAWHGLDIFMDFAGAGNITVENPVRAVVETVMFQTMYSDQAYDALARKFYDSVDGMMGSAVDLLEHPAAGVLEDEYFEGTPGALEELSLAIKSANKLLRAADVTTDSATLFNKASAGLDALCDILKECHVQKIPDAYAPLIGPMFDGLTHLMDGSEEYYHEWVRTRVLFNAYLDATDDWMEFWHFVMMEAVTRTSRYELFARDGSIAEEIERVLDEVKAARDDAAVGERFEAHMDEVFQEVTLENSVELFSEVVFDAIPLESDIKAIMVMTKFTHGAINLAIDMDDIAICGQYAYISAELTRCASFALATAEAGLREGVDYANAVRFDAFFHHYRTVMCQTLRYMIDYDRQITDALLYKAFDIERRVFEIYHAVRFLHFPQEHFNKESELELLASLLAIWEVRECHGIEPQLALIDEYIDLWNPLEDPDNFAPYFRYAVTDMDGNGRLEILSTWMYGNGFGSFTNLYEVNEDMDALEEVTVDQGDFMPDFDMAQAAPIYLEDGRYYIIVPDYNRAGWEHEETAVVSACLEDGQLTLEKLGTSETTNYEDGSSDTEYYDVDGDSISERDYLKLPSQYWPDVSGGKMTFAWITYEDDQDVYEQLLASWNGFGRAADTDGD